MTSVSFQARTKAGKIDNSDPISGQSVDATVPFQKGDKIEFGKSNYKVTEVAYLLVEVELGTQLRQRADVKVI